MNPNGQQESPPKQNFELRAQAWIFTIQVAHQDQSHCQLAR